MADEDLAIAPVALETPASEPAATPEPATPVDEPTRILDPGEEPELEVAAETVEPVDEDDDLEFSHKTYRVPKTLKENVEKMRAEYTRATQAAAEARKALETHNLQQAEASEAELDVRADLRRLSKTLEEYTKLTPEDWAAHQAADPSTTENHWRNFQLLKDQRADLEATLSKAAAERTEKSQSDLTKRIQETVEHAQKAIPGWKPDTIPKLVEYAATERNIPADVIKANWSPTFIDLLYRAQIGDQLLKKQATAPKLPTAQPGQPLKTVNGNSSPAARGDLGSMDMEAYKAARQSGVGGKSPFR